MDLRNEAVDLGSVELQQARNRVNKLLELERASLLNEGRQRGRTISDLGNRQMLETQAEIDEEINRKKNLKEAERFVAQKEKLSKTWTWPTNGKVGAKFDPNNGKKGIEILGEIGQEIRTVSRGKVIYAGEDLKGYGKLIIIKHDDNLITVYGNAQEILVSEGQSVEAAEAIATMGNSIENEVKLIFEVRKGGQSIDPMLYLKKTS